MEVDVAKLPKGSAVLGNNPSGHVSVRATPDEIKAAVEERENFHPNDSHVHAVLTRVGGRE